MDINFALYSFIALFLIVDPLANVPLFLAILEGCTLEEKERMIRKAVVIAAVVLFVFTLLGTYIFKFLGIEIYSFKIAGGILLFIISIEMLFGRKTRTESSREEEREMLKKEDVVITPLAVPLLTGPGAITTGIVLFNSAKTLTNQVVLFLNIILVFIASYIILSKSKYIFDALGYTGTRVIIRIMGLLLGAIAVQFILAGIAEALKVLK